jgi:hypothetical protein
MTCMHTYTYHDMYARMVCRHFCRTVTKISQRCSVYLLKDIREKGLLVVRVYYPQMHAQEAAG